MMRRECLKEIGVANKKIGGANPAYIVAEIGFNHEGNMELAVRMIEAAAKVGVDAVKFQSFSAGNLVLDTSDHFNLIKQGELSADDHKYLANAARGNGITFLSTPFDKKNVDVLETIGVSAYKVASMDLTNLPLLQYIATTGKPMILSTGMGNLKEIAEAVETVMNKGNSQIILLHCISHYPAAPGDANLCAISYLKEVFGLPVGWSDHVLGNAVALAAVAMGACVIEKHFTVDKSLPGPDHKLSANPDEMLQLVQDIRIIEKSMGSSKTLWERPDRQMSKIFRRGIFAGMDISAGTVITEGMVKCLRPEEGLPPKNLETVIGRVAKVAIKKNQPILWDMI